jgi:organic radical activating enzyme
MNAQAPEHKSHQLDTLDVHSIFLTIQGEGPFTGCPAVFVRLAGCNLQCPGCDTDYTSKRERMSPSAIAAKVIDLSGPAVLVVITGGEPFRQNIADLCKRLVGLAYNVQIETNGTLPISSAVPLDVHVVCSPKTGSVHKSIERWANLSYKYVLKHGEASPVDGLPLLALGHSAAPHLARPPVGFTGNVYVQPMDEGHEVLNSLNLLACIESVMAFNYRLQLQTHKLIGVE